MSHFSQVIWRSSELAGFGMAVSDDGHNVYAVGNYTPPGNVVGHWNQNVPAPVNGKIWVPDRSEYM
ncbi:unnamed protein product [Protopolystoma xenopodis]|uniref:SCP domain-containing protein n=1 Tax=Protopolystoma xenopodis TaxID=117903 RepID=A0A448WC16_9PLAT|nr:unnamed protein product [Protopolystoma xenopodis]